MNQFNETSRAPSQTDRNRPAVNLYSAAAIACLLAACALLVIALLSGCGKPPVSTDSSEPKIPGDEVLIPTNSAQLSALIISSVEKERGATVTLPGRLIWDEEATVRVFSPFAGRVQKIAAQLNHPVAPGAPLAEILSADYATALAESRKAESDFRRAERALTRARDLAEHGAAPRKDLESAEADFESARAEKERAAARLSIYATTQQSDAAGFLLPSPLEGIVVEKN